PPPPYSTFFPYTTLFRSRVEEILIPVPADFDRDPALLQFRRQFLAPVVPHHAVRPLIIRRHDQRVVPHLRHPLDDLLEVQHAGRSEEHTSELQSRGHLVC